jgi:hypothetical protein
LCPILHTRHPTSTKFVRTNVRDNLLTDGHFREICSWCTHNYACALKLHVFVEVSNALVKPVCYVTEGDICCLAGVGRCTKVILCSTISASYPIMLYVAGLWMVVWKAKNVCLNILC